MRLLAPPARPADALRAALAAAARLDLATPELSLFAWGELRAALERVPAARLALPLGDADDLALLGAAADRPARNRLQARWLAGRLAAWVARAAEVRAAGAALPQALYVTRDAAGVPAAALAGACALTTDGLGLTPARRLGFSQAAESPAEAGQLGQWFDTAWGTLRGGDARDRLVARLAEVADHKAPALVYHAVLHHVLAGVGDALDEDRVVRAATGIRDTAVWRKLYRFQRDAVVGAIDKLERLGGCIIADSVGLGKTFEALAVIKYYELRNDRVLVLCPKRLRDNWTLHKANDRRNTLAADRLRYDVLNHTDLSREAGESGDVDLAHVNWGNYDLVVIDESHNFRNKGNYTTRETRYDRLMRRVIREGVKTKVLMLSATPVNNRLADLKNQIAFATEGDDAALAAHGIPSVEGTVRRAQTQFSAWLAAPPAERTPAALLDRLGFDYFTLLDLLTIARSRKHIQRYYGTDETGTFPERLPPRNVKADVDLAREFPPIADVNTSIRKLTLAAYAPLRYVLPKKRKAYDDRYSVQIRGGESVFRQVQREESLVHLLRINLLKRMESSVASFALTVERQLAAVDALLRRLGERPEHVDELTIEDVDLDDPTMETLLVGSTVRVLLQDVDAVRWRQDLAEDRGRLAALRDAARAVSADRDAKLADLRRVVAEKVRDPLNPSNRKVLVFTAFADTARYLYDALAPWAHDTFGVRAALVTGSGSNRTNAPGGGAGLAGILAAFAPRAKERDPALAGEGEIDLLVATDCISEGQNLQDCDFLVNYDIHWNPVRIVQRFGRVDRIGSPNARVQLVNFWPNMELEEYIQLERRVSGRMVLLDVSATGEENLIEQESGDRMNDLAYRRAQLQKLQDAVIDLEDLSSGVSIADLTLGDFRLDLARYEAAHPGALARLPLGSFAVATAFGSGDWGVPPGTVFCLRASADDGEPPPPPEPGYPLAPHYLVHVGDDGAVLLPYTQAKQILDRLKRLAAGRDRPDAAACAHFDRLTRGGEDMAAVQRQLAAAVAAVAGRQEERAAASLFTPGGTHARRGEFRGADRFEVVAFVVILPEPAPDPAR